MYIDELILTFEKAVSNFPELNNGEVLDLLRASIVAKKYDLQDEGLIEAVLREDKKDLIESFEESFEKTLEDLDEDVAISELLKRDDIKKEAIKIFITSLEHLIDYYYNNIIGKHFSST
ncbi:MAG: hypothetical protein V3R67_01225 [Thermodesulfobacteriota bacterium]|nr:hypothetical protein [Candidatus Dadabacteria bacterium]